MASTATAKAICRHAVSWRKFDGRQGGFQSGAVIPAATKPNQPAAKGTRTGKTILRDSVKVLGNFRIRPTRRDNVNSFHLASFRRSLYTLHDFCSLTADRAGKELMSDFWAGRPVFVTGGTGFLGNWVVRQLLAQRARVTVLSRSKPIDAHDSDIPLMARTVCGDVRDHAGLERILNESGALTVFHLAGQPIVGTAERDPVSTLEVNVAGTWSLLEACRRNPQVSQIVIASSEKALARRGNVYPISKACADLIAGMFFQTYRSPVCIGRFSNVYGGGDLHWERIVPGTIRSVLCGQPPVIRSHGSVRDFLYVEDAAAGLLQLAEHAHSDSTLFGNDFDFSGGAPRTIREVVDAILESAGSSLRPVLLNEHSEEPDRRSGTAAQVRRMLRWEPQYTLEEGLRGTISWYTGFARTKPFHFIPSSQAG